MIDRNMKKKDLVNLVGLSPTVMTKMAKNEYVSLDVIVRICGALNVDVGDIMEVVDTR